LNTLASRVDYARSLLAAVGSERLLAKDLSAELIRQLRNLKDPEIDATIGMVWGSVRETAADKAKLIGSYKARLATKPAQPPDPSLGRAVFIKTCQQCHTLFGVGGRVGPDLTGSNRADLDYLLSNVLDPSALIGKDYQAQVVATTNGRVLTGILRSEDKDSITLLSANDIVTIPKSEVEERRTSDQSMMPDDLWKTLSDHAVRSLLAYLASPVQVLQLATLDTTPGFFNGRDLSGWEGNHLLWKVVNQEIVGKTTGLSHNDFLRGEILVEDFRLRVEVKLVGNQGNSGIQFRSQPLPQGDVKGYQADIGAGWWGKLYEENGRGLLWPKSGEAYLKPGAWNLYEIVAVGPKIRTYLNGHLCVELDDPAGPRRGVFAFQLHAGGPTEVRFRNLKLELSPKLAPSQEPARSSN
jgi:putative heme-binding domain-containing protein